MPVPPFKDLTPRRDPKGGETKRYGATATPPPIPQAEYQQYVVSNGGWHTGWISGIILGLWAGTTLAWFTAWSGKGISTKDLQEYEEKYSPYVQERALLAEHNALQDTQIGKLQGLQEQNAKHLSELDTKFHDDERDLIEFKAATEKNNKYWSDYIEAQQKVKK